MTNMSIQPLWLTHFIEILLVLEFQLTKFIVSAFSYKVHFRPQISSNMMLVSLVRVLTLVLFGRMLLQLIEIILFQPLVLVILVVMFGMVLLTQVMLVVVLLFQLLI